MFLRVWPPEGETTWMFFGLGCSFLFAICLAWSCVPCCLWFCFKNLILFLRSSISLSISVVCFVLEGLLLIISRSDVVYELDVVSPAFSRELVVLPYCLFCLISQMLNFWISDVDVSFNGISIRFLKVCCSHCRRLFFYWLGFVFQIVENVLNFCCCNWRLVASTFVFNVFCQYLAVLGLLLNFSKLFQYFDAVICRFDGLFTISCYVFR